MEVTAVQAKKNHDLEGHWIFASSTILKESDGVPMSYPVSKVLRCPWIFCSYIAFISAKFARQQISQTRKGFVKSCNVPRQAPELNSVVLLNSC